MPLWLFTARDKPGRLEPRKATRPTHRDYITRKDLPAEMVFGSPLLDENGDMNGTWLVLLADSALKGEKDIGLDVRGMLAFRCCRDQLGVECSAGSRVTQSRVTSCL